MRSEKEIREKHLNEFCVEVIADKEMLRNRVVTLNHTALKNWLLAGEPRYSVAELEKIKAAFSNPTSYTIASWEAVIDSCKRQPDAVQALLEGKEWKVQEALNG